MYKIIIHEAGIDRVFYQSEDFKKVREFFDRIKKLNFFGELWFGHEKTE